MKKRVLAGMRPTGRLHLGNYLGGAKGMVELQEKGQYETLYMVADLHALTTPYDKKTLSKNAREVVLDYLAVGLDPAKSAIFIQSDLADLHAQLAYYLSTAVSVARMQHLPTFKEKVKQYPQNVTMALLNYPVLMAADILIYKADKVPVGIDQEPHLEIAREVARKMNLEYKTDFPEPTRFVTKGEYIPSLTGEGKMSKSVEGSFINLTDNLEAIKEKLAKVPTDSGKGSSVPSKGGVSSLFVLIGHFQGDAKRKEYQNAYMDKGIKYQELKENLAESIYKELAPIQAARKRLEKDKKYVDAILETGSKKARKIAQETILEVKEKMGLS